MQHLLAVESIEALLLEVPALIRRLDDHDPTFASAVSAWLSKAEDTLSQSRLAAAASAVAACRGELISSERGFGQRVPGQRPGPRQFREGRAAELLARATDAVTNAVQARRAQLDEAERVMMQVVAVADRIGVIPADNGQGRGRYLQDLVESLAARTEFASLVAHVTGLLGMADLLIVLDRAIARVRQ